MKCAVFGGTFSPPHIGHLIVAEHVRAELGLDEVMFVPAATPPHKIGQDIVAPEHRLAMLNLAVEGNLHFAASRIEIDRGGVSFTVDTLRELKRANPSDDLYVLIGMDNLLDFHMWKAPEEIIRHAKVVVMTRPGFERKDLPPKLQNNIIVCPVPEIGIASRELRERIRAGKSIRYVVADTVRDYIYANKLYV